MQAHDEPSIRTRRSQTATERDLPPPENGETSNESDEENHLNDDQHRRCKEYFRPIKRQLKALRDSDEIDDVQMKLAVIKHTIFTIGMKIDKYMDENANADLNDELLWRFVAENFWPGTRREEWKVVRGLYLSIKTSGEEAKVIVTEKAGR
ncbi:hypothetical protein HDV00_005335 [Rhizophlyctis rosea]|nr:hypothetical protein HDV00_005335 [Rhizophlyctis rosea]